jgi:transcriptional regulator with XRE-family HTH domain
MQNVNDSADETFDAGDYLRKVRRVADLSQRELAKVSCVPRSAIERIESGALDPRIGQLGQLLALLRWRLVVIDDNHHLVLPLVEFEHNMRDGADRRFPAHLDVVVDPQNGEWWADMYGMSRPPETFGRNRAIRDEQRARSQYDLYRGPYKKRR